MNEFITFLLDQQENVERDRLNHSIDMLHLATTRRRQMARTDSETLISILYRGREFITVSHQTRDQLNTGVKQLLDQFTGLKIQVFPGNKVIMDIDMLLQYTRETRDMNKDHFGLFCDNLTKLRDRGFEVTTLGLDWKTEGETQTKIIFGGFFEIEKLKLQHSLGSNRTNAI